jgi:hypothetical protein
MSEELKPCPCGRPLDALIIEPGQCSKYAYVYGNCCNEWMIEFRTEYKDINSKECLELGTKAWNRTPRGTCNE